MNRMFIAAGIMLAFGLALPAMRAQPSDPKAEALFALKVLPLLRTKCFACHGGEAGKIKGGLDLTSRAGLVKGGDEAGPAIISGQPAASPLFRAVSRADADLSPMPPKEADMLSPADLD